MCFQVSYAKETSHRSRHQKRAAPLSRTIGAGPMEGGSIAKALHESVPWPNKRRRPTLPKTNGKIKLLKIPIFGWKTIPSSFWGQAKNCTYFSRALTCSLLVSGRV